MTKANKCPLPNKCLLSNNAPSTLLKLYYAPLLTNKCPLPHENYSQGRTQDFSKGGSQRLLTAALPRVSAGSVILLKTESLDNAIIEL